MLLQARLCSSQAPLKRSATSTLWTFALMTWTVFLRNTVDWCLQASHTGTRFSRSTRHRLINVTSDTSLTRPPSSTNFSSMPRSWHVIISNSSDLWIAVTSTDDRNDLSVRWRLQTFFLYFWDVFKVFNVLKIFLNVFTSMVITCRTMWAQLCERPRDQSNNVLWVCVINVHCLCLKLCSQVFFNMFCYCCYRFFHFFFIFCVVFLYCLPSSLN